MNRFPSERNFGYGKQLAFAGQQALRTAYQGRFATVAAHAERWGQLAAWCKAQGLREARLITREVVRQYGRELAVQVKAGQMKVAYAQNLLSSVNVTLAALRGDSQIRVAPAALVGERTAVRQEAPASLDRTRLAAAVAELRAAGHLRAACVLELARDLGLRLREAARLNAREALQQAERYGKINVTEGTKGGRGREVDRWVPVSAQAQQSLLRAAQAQGDSRNLIPAHQRWVQFNDHVHTVIRPVLARHDLKGVHDGRAAYACERYHTLTGHAAPVVAGRRLASKTDDQEARVTLAQELGHGRTDVLAAYIGSSR